jgi:hypothetical protein
MKPAFVELASTLRVVPPWKIIAPEVFTVSPLTISRVWGVNACSAAEPMAPPNVRELIVGLMSSVTESEPPENMTASTVLFRGTPLFQLAALFQLPVPPFQELMVGIGRVQR